MSRHAAAGFVATVALLVPAGWHLLGADIEKDGKHLRPMQQELDVDGVKVSLDVDRSVVMTGDAITATLVAASDTPKDVSIDLRALHSQNNTGERVELPWQQIARETVVLHAAPGGGKPVSTRIRLGKRPSRLAVEDSFKIMINKHGVKPVRREFDNGRKAPDYDALMGEDGTSAAGVYVRGWSGNSLAMTIEPKGPVTAAAPFTIAVTIKNTSGHELADVPWINLSTEDALQADDDDAGPSLDIEPVDTAADTGDAEPQPVKRKQQVTRLFTITPHGKLPATIAFLATATENDGLGPHGAGAMDIVTIGVADPSAAVAAK